MTGTRERAGGGRRRRRSPRLLNPGDYTIQRDGHQPPVYGFGQSTTHALLPVRRRSSTCGGGGEPRATTTVTVSERNRSMEILFSSLAGPAAVVSACRPRMIDRSSERSLSSSLQEQQESPACLPVCSVLPPARVYGRYRCRWTVVLFIIRFLLVAVRTSR